MNDEGGLILLFGGMLFGVPLFFGFIQWMGWLT